MDAEFRFRRVNRAVAEPTVPQAEMIGGPAGIYVDRGGSKRSFGAWIDLSQPSPAIRTCQGLVADQDDPDGLPLDAPRKA